MHDLSKMFLLTFDTVDARKIINLTALQIAIATNLQHLLNNASNGLYWNISEIRDPVVTNQITGM